MLLGSNGGCIGGLADLPGFDHHASKEVAFTKAGANAPMSLSPKVREK